MAEHKESKKLHIAMYPWFAFGHMIPFLHLSNHLAKRGHQVSLLLSKKALLQLQHAILFPDLISCHAVPVPPVDGLPPGAETVNDVPLVLNGHLVRAMDLTRDHVEQLLRVLRPDVVLFDFAYWLPDLGSKMGFKTVYHSICSPAFLAMCMVPARGVYNERRLTVAELMEPPPGYPSSTVVLRRPHEARMMSWIWTKRGSDMTYYDRFSTAMRKCDAISIRTYQEIEGYFCEYIGSQFGKPVFLPGPTLDEPAEKQLEDRWESWLGRFKPGSVVFCALGSNGVLGKAEFQELVLGLELTGLPFMAVMKPPTGAKTLEEALPEGFEGRVRERGVVYGGWVPQTEILGHRSVGCFVSHCGFGSVWESLMSDTQIVLVPHIGDHFLNTRLMVDELKVAVEVEREESGWFSKDSLSKAIKSVMDQGGEVGPILKKNHAQLRETLASPGFMSGYVDKFVEKLREL